MNNFFELAYSILIVKEIRRFFFSNLDVNLDLIEIIRKSLT